MVKIPSPEVAKVRKEKARRSRFTNQIRTALASGREAYAYKLAKTFGCDIFEARLPKEYQSPAESWFVAKEAELKALEIEAKKAEIWNRGEAEAERSGRTTEYLKSEIKATSGSNSLFSPEVVAIVDAKADLGEQLVQINDDIRVPEVAVVENPVLDVPVPLPTEPKQEELAPPMVRGWPVEVENAEVWGACRNPNLMVALLPDKRKVSMYQGKFRVFRFGTKVKLRLEQPFLDGERQGDPIYVAYENRGNIW